MQSEGLRHLTQDTNWCNELVNFPSDQIINYKFVKDDIEYGSAIIIKRKLRMLPFFYLKINFGPIIDYENKSQLQNMLIDLKRIAKESKAILIEFNPYVWDLNLEDYSTKLKEYGFVKAYDHVYRNTIMVDLSLSEDEIFDQFERRCQKAIRQSVSRGVHVRLVPMNLMNYDIFYNLYKGTCARTQFIPEDYDLLKKQLLYWGSINKVFLFFAYTDNTVVAALVLFNNGDSISTVYQGNDYSPEIMNKRPSNALYWESLKWSKKNGFKLYDFGGVTVTDYNGNEKKEGIHNFKIQFGGRLVSLPGNYKFVNRIFINLIVNTILPIYSKFAIYKAKVKYFEKN